jgi:predicted transcriptional regulator
MGAQKKVNPAPVPEKKKVVNETADNLIQKAEIERMKKLLSEKIKNPELAKKAAMIISEMLNSKN